MLTCLKCRNASRKPLLSQINCVVRALTYNLNWIKTTRASAMFNSSELSDELQTLKSECRAF